MKVVWRIISMLMLSLVIGLFCCNPAVETGPIHTFDFDNGYVVPSRWTDVEQSEFALIPDSLVLLSIEGVELPVEQVTVSMGTSNKNVLGDPIARRLPATRTLKIPGKDGLEMPRKILATGETRPASMPKPQKAGPSVTRDNAIFNIPYLGISQGLSSNTILSIKEDSEGNLWLGNDDGTLSRFDGNNFLHFSAANGFTDDEINVIEIDQEGHLWLGLSAFSGLCRFDGTSTTTHYSKSAGIESRSIWALKKDRQGQLWMGTSEQGLVKFDGRHFFFFTTKTGLPSNEVTALEEDDAGNLWIGTKGGGVACFDGQGFVHYPWIAAGTGDWVQAIRQDEQGRMWFGTRLSGLYHLKADQLEQYTVEQGLKMNRIRQLVQGKPGQLWVGIEGGGLSRLGLDGPRPRIANFDRNNGLINPAIVSLLKDTRGNLWFGSLGGGLGKFTPGSFSHINRQVGLRSNSARTITQDRHGHIWFGTQWGDISRMEILEEDKERRQFTHYFQNTTNPKWMISSLEDRLGNMWFGSFGEGLIRLNIDSVSGQETFELFSDKTGVFNNYIELIFEDVAGHLWIGTYDAGVLKFDGEQFTQISSKAGLPATHVISLAEDDENQMWFGTIGDGVVRMTEKGFTRYRFGKGLRHNTIRTIVKDRKGRLWFGSEGGGVFMYDGTGFTNFRLGESRSAGIIRSIQEDGQGNFWFSTVNGLYRVFIGEVPGAVTGPVRFLRFSEAEGLKTSEFLENSNLLDRDNRMYWGTESGVTTIDLTNLDGFAPAPQAQIAEVLVNQDFVDFRDQQILADRGIKVKGLEPFSIVPDEPTFSHESNSLTFGFSTNSWSAPRQVRYQCMLEGFDRDWNQAQSANKVDYRNLPPGKYRLKVRVVGESGRWSDTLVYPFIIAPQWFESDLAKVVYALVLFGLLLLFRRYEIRRRQRQHKREIQVARLEEKSKRSDEIKQQAEALRKSLDELQQKNVEIVEARDQLIAQEKMASLGQMAAGIAHEIKNPLNFVTNFSEDSIELAEELAELIGRHKEGVSQELYPELQEIAEQLAINAKDIHKNGFRLDRIVRSMMDHVRADPGFKNEIDLNELLADNLHLAYHSRKMQEETFNVSLVEDYDEDLAPTAVYSQELGRAFLNILNNACYAVHEKQLEANEGYEPSIRVSTRQEGKRVVIRIRDNGPGISEPLTKRIFEPFYTSKPTGKGNAGLGLSICYDIVKKHGGRLKVKSEEGAFTEFEIQIPHIKND